MLRLATHALRRACALPRVGPVLLASPPRRGIKGVVIGENVSRSKPTGNLTQSVVGQHIEQPYELTVSEGWLAMWHSGFFQHDRLYTSTPFANQLGFKAQLLPFSLMLYQTVSMSHVEEGQEIIDLGFDQVTYVRPGYPGDTFKKSFHIKRLRPSQSHESSTIVTLRCELYNQRNQLCFSCDKVMLYPYEVSRMQRSKDPVESDPTLMPRETSHLLEHIKDNVKKLPPSVTLTSVEPGQLILHTYSRPTGLGASSAMNTLFRQAHPLLLNLGRYSREELVLSGPTVLAQTVSASSRALFEVLSEEVTTCRFMNKVAPHETVGAVSYISHVERLPGSLEEITMVTFGLREMDVMIELKDVDLPSELFTRVWDGRTQIEAFIEEHCPILQNKVAVVMHRKMLRQAPLEHEQIPLL